MKFSYNYINNINKFELPDINLLLQEIEKQTKDLFKNQQELEFSIVIETDSFVQNLNQQYRNKNKTTNVLSFANYNFLKQKEELAELELGDIIFSYQTLEQESQEQKKTIKNHFLHLLTHSILHLIGYNHIEQTEQEIMENLEIGILEKLNISDPYHI